MSKYYIHKENKGLKVKFEGSYRNSNRYFTAIAKTVEGSAWELNQFMNGLVYDDFKPYTPTPQELIEWGETATLTNENPNKVEVDDKDINLRLECLKLALQYQISNPLIGARGFYDWITTNQTS